MKYNLFFIFYFFVNYILHFTMNSFLQENNIEYKIVKIYNNIYKFELNDVSIHCTTYENKKNYNKNYYTIIIYVPQEIYEIKYNLLQKNKIKLLGIIEHMNIYKYYVKCENINEATNIIQLFI